MMIFRIIALFMLLLPAAAFAQNAKIDSLKRVIETTKVDTVKGRTLCRLCFMLMQAGNEEEAIEYYNKGMNHTNRVNDEEGKAICIVNMGTIKLRKNDLSAALSHYEKGLAISTKYNNKYKMGLYQRYIADVYFKIGDIGNAVSKCQASGELLKQAGYISSAAESYNLIGTHILYRGMFNEASKYLAEAMSLYKKSNNTKGTAGALINIGISYAMRDQHAKAIEYYLQGIEIAKEHKHLDYLANAYSNMSNSHIQTFRPSKAIEYQQLSIEIRKSIGDSLGIATSLVDFGRAYESQANYPQALESYSRALAFLERNENQAILHQKSGTYYSIGTLYYSQGQYQKSLNYFKKALEINEKLGKQMDIASTLAAIGSTYKYLGELDSSNKNLYISLEIYHTMNMPSGIAQIYNALGGNSMQKQNLDEAIDFYTKSLQIILGTEGSGYISHSYTALGNAYFAKKDYVKSRQLALNGIYHANATEDLGSKKYGNQLLYQADSALGNWKSAFEAARLYHIYSDSLKNDEKSKEFGRIEAKVEYEKQAEIDRLKTEEEKKRERERFTWALGSAGGGLLLLLVIAFTLFRGRQKEKKANSALRTLNEEIQQQKTEIEAINSELQATLKEVNEQKQEIEEQHAKIEDSIRYASRIQGAILPKAEDLQAALPAHFIHFQPRDIVSGDFYWMTQQDGKTFFASVDCTGHGVPGAFMSVLGSNLLHQIVDENQITEPDVILAELDRRIAATLRQQFGGDSKDGMDLALVVIHEADKDGKRTVEYAGAGRPLWVWSNGEITEYKSAKYSCGGSQHESKEYPAHRIEARKGDRIYIFSDGPVDQFGGPKGRKLGSTQLQAFLQETAGLPIEEQGKRFGAFFNDWMKARKQLDDVLIAGVAV